MKSQRYLVALAALAFTLPAQAAQNDPEVVIYRATGAVDNSGGGGATATSIACTPFSGVSENVRVVVRAQNGTLLANALSGVAHLNTVTFSTSDVTIFFDVNMATGAVAGGTVAVAATSTSVNCTAMLIQPNSTAPVGVQLHLTRFNPLAGTAE